MGFFMMKKYLILLFLLGSLTTVAQKVVQKQWDTTGIQRVQVLSDSIFKIEVKSVPGDQILVEAAIEGELYENLVLDGLNKEGILSLKVGLTPFFEAANDKLAAHKVVSVSLKIQMPEALTLVVSSRLADLLTEGPFRHVQAALYNGRLSMVNFKGTATLSTHHGPIDVEAFGPVYGIATSKNASVSNQLPKEGLLPIRAQSVNGAIRLRHSHQ